MELNDIIYTINGQFRFICNPYPKKSPYQLGRLPVTLFNLEAILPA